MDLEFHEVVQAYFDCRKAKRNTLYALDFEFNLESNLFDLYEEILSGEYKIGESIAFVIEQPKIREIWCATFKDRIVHHIIYNRLRDRFFNSFIRNTFACIQGRGSLDASNQLFAGIRSLTCNWSKPGYFLGGDMRSFFVSIHKPTLNSILQRKITEPWLKELTELVLFHNPRSNCFLKSKPEVFDRVPKHKSLWHTSEDRGLPIGNLTSQFFANVYLNELDQFVKHKLKAKYYYRYVDDFIILHESPDFLNQCYDEIDRFLVDVLKIDLHPFKKRLGRVKNGIDFVGFFHKPFYRVPRKRTSHRLKSLVHQWHKNPRGLDVASLIRFRNSINSYYGFIRQGSSYHLRRHLGEKVNSIFIWPDKNFEKMIIS